MNHNTINRLVVGSIPAGPTVFVQQLLNFFHRSFPFQLSVL